MVAVVVAIVSPPEIGGSLIASGPWNSECRSSPASFRNIQIGAAARLTRTAATDTPVRKGAA
jgi:hypothetical protein